MLVLTRKTGETIQIGDNIELTVLSIQGDQIKLGIKAPKNIGILRKEIYDSIQESNNEAASVNKNILNQLKMSKLDL
ncbi:carbon storage regulator CsrA [Metabacillus litoralis]|uniref:carbon storage regulator CsrA n=1 Tax=Metabacillus litoralis TaxID=152268 RepID=UPI000EF5FD21|nr:carbon storage regulator CsrA [Metabacillus litoralis]